MFLSLPLFAAGLLFTGCEASHPPARVDVPQHPGEGQRVQRDEMRPLSKPDGRGELPPPPFDDAALVTQTPPEQRAYLKAYESVGRPRLIVAVNRGVANEAHAADAEKSGA